MHIGWIHHLANTMNKQDLLDLWVRHEKLSLMHEIDTFSLQSDDDRIVSHDAPRFMLYIYHCVRDTSWSVIFSTREVNIDRSARCGWFPNMFRFSSFCFWDYRVGLYSLCFKGEFQRCFDWEGFYMYFTDLSRTTCSALGRTVNTNYKTRNW